MNNDACTFEIFPHAVKPARSVKKDLEIFIKKRAQFSISNLNLAHLEAKDSMYRPLKHIEPIENSESLKFNSLKSWRDKQLARNRDDNDLD